MNHIASQIIKTLILVFWSFASLCFARDGARLIVDQYNGRANKIITVLSKYIVQSDLGLTSNQLVKIEIIHNMPIESMPFGSNLIAKARKAEKAENIRIMDQAIMLADDYRITCLSNTLTAAQFNRLSEIMLQVDGIRSVIQNQGIAIKLYLTDVQINKFKEVEVLYDPLLKPLYRRLGRQQIAGLRVDETILERSKEEKCLMYVIGAIEIDKDRDLEAILMSSQREQWRKLIGLPVKGELWE